MAKTIDPPIPVDTILERLDAVPEDRRREAFFSELAALPEFSHTRMELSRWRVKYARGPYGRDELGRDEWNILAGFTYPIRHYSPAEVARYADHAAAVEHLARATDALRAAIEQTRRARNAVGAASIRRDTDKGGPQRAKLALDAARDRETAAREAYEEIAAGEILLRPFQPERRAATGRNWLRRMVAAAGGGK